ncbi:MAG: hypothetical protein RLN88_10830 [Ekhidna sp.]|uniref:hypothetical protein n=1 Tax=Ekhidna sp. TaxID=2608089 RepID=UPI0032EB243F
MNKHVVVWIFLKTLFQIGLLSLMLLLSGCINDDAIDFPEEPDFTSFSQSTAIISLLRSVKNNTLSEDQDCFTLFYPIELGFNNDITITVGSYQALQEITEDVNTNIHINKVEFPILVSKAGTVKSIKSESQLTQLLDECGLLTLRDEFDKYFTQCFDFAYPIKMIATDSSQVKIDSLGDYFDFEFEQGFDKQPVFVYPLEINSFSKDQKLLINNDFELFEVFDMCDSCPQLFFSIDWAEDTRYVFEADFPGIDELESFDWYIDRIKVETDGAGVDGDFKLEETFNEGTYEICIKTQAPEFDCFAGTSYCTTLEVVDPCPILSIEVNPIEADSIQFIATFDRKDEIDYTWAIYQDQDLIFFEEELEGGDNKFGYQFDPGTYNVCLEAEVHGCSTVSKVCEEIIVN